MLDELLIKMIRKEINFPKIRIIDSTLSTKTNVNFITGKNRSLSTLEDDSLRGLFLSLHLLTPSYIPSV